MFSVFDMSIPAYLKAGKERGLPRISWNFFFVGNPNPICFSMVQGFFPPLLKISFMDILDR
jgi:hypothetical protein